MPSSRLPNGGVAWPTCICIMMFCSGDRQVAHLRFVALHDLAVELGGDLARPRRSRRCFCAQRAKRAITGSACGRVVPAGNLTVICFRLSTALRGSATRILRTSSTPMIEMPPGTGIGLLIVPGDIVCSAAAIGVGQLLRPDPAEVAADRGGRSFGILAGISRRRMRPCAAAPGSGWRGRRPATCRRPAPAGRFR